MYQGIFVDNCLLFFFYFLNTDINLYITARGFNDFRFKVSVRLIKYLFMISATFLLQLYPFQIT